jgi:hypothetical protein
MHNESPKRPRAYGQIRKEVTNNHRQNLRWARQSALGPSSLLSKFAANTSGRHQTNITSPPVSTRIHVLLTQNVVREVTLKFVQNKLSFKEGLHRD